MRVGRDKIWFAAFGAVGVCCGLAACGGNRDFSLGTAAPAGGGVERITKAQLGKALFFDTALSNPPGFACSTCHSPTLDFTDAHHSFPTSQGVVSDRFGFRNAPSISYMMYSPNFSPGNGTNIPAVGGQFLDGHASNLSHQVVFPFTNPLEMNNATRDDVVAKVKAGGGATALKQLYGANIFSNPTNAFYAISDAIVQYETSSVFAPFSSKYDYYLEGKVKLSSTELAGLAIFNGKAKCASCHPSARGPKGQPPLFTNFQYENLGVPRNASNPYYTVPKPYNDLGAAFVDTGLERTTQRPSDAGKFMVPSLRNITVTGPYLHNGIYSTLNQTLDFITTRDSGFFGHPEVPQNLNHVIGNIKLTPQESTDLVDFLYDLKDGYQVK